MRLAISFMIAALTALALAPATQAGAVADHAARAETLMKNQDPVAALRALDEAVEEIWQRSPLVFRKALFVENSAGFGIYAERESNVFAQGDPLLVYAEPIGFAYGKNAVGGSEISLVVDFILEDPNGNKLLDREDFLAVTLPVRYHNREFNIMLTVRLSGLPEGEYVAKFHVRDKHSDKNGDFSLPFEVAG